MTRAILLTFVIGMLLGCSPIQVTDYKDARPLFDAEQFFSGQLSAHGIVKDRSGKVIRSFNADLVAGWTDGVGTLAEEFVFDDGERQRRVWTLRKSGDGRYTGTAGDVVGEAQLQQSGNALFLDYVLRLPYRGGDVDVRVDDRMYLITPDVLINESALSKFGLQVGSLTLVIVRHPAR